MTSENVYGESVNFNDVKMPPETLLERLEADGRLWRLGFGEGFRDGQVSALRGFADSTRFPSHWVLFRRDDGSGVTVSDLLRETADRIESQETP